MELNFKNTMVKTCVEGFGMDFLDAAGKKSGFSLEKMSFNIPVGYFLSLCDSAELCESAFDSHPTLDLTYKTVEHLPFILAMQHGDYVVNNEEDKEHALSITKKTLAAYLMLLCMNEHNCFPTIYQLKNIDQIMAVADVIGKRPDDSWMGMVIKVGVNEEIDLLGEMGNAVSLNDEGYLKISFARVAELYKRMCGVDLYEYGVEDVEITAA